MPKTSQNLGIKKRLKAWRRAKRLLQKQAAELFGVSVRTYEGWESGAHAPQGMAFREFEKVIAANK